MVARLNTKLADRLYAIRELMRDITDHEKKVKSRNTIVIGDFNANPYDEEMVNVDAFNAVLFKQVILNSASQVYQGSRLERMYNPILDYISEERKLYGSFYMSSNSPFWYCLDQVIVRRPLVNSIEDLEYIKKIGNKSLLSRQGLIDKDISDHLPLYVKINEAAQ